LTPEDLLRAYEAALATQNWANVEPLLDDEVCVTFSNGTFLRGKHEVGAAFSTNFALIEDETYELADVVWIANEPSHAVCAYSFHWSGLIDGKPAAGSGRGTCVITRSDGRWRLLAEHLGPAPRPSA
jgi:ketosteroid isomerase-like protein